MIFESKDEETEEMEKTKYMYPTQALTLHLS